MQTPYTFLQDLAHFPLRHTLGSHRFKHQEGWVNGIVWHSDSQSFFTIHNRGRILQTSIKTGEPIGEVVEFDWWVSHLAVSPNGEKWLLTGMMGEIALYETKSKKLRFLRERPRDYVSAAQNCQSAFAPNGEYAVTIGRTAPAFFALYYRSPGVAIPDYISPPFLFSPNKLLFASCYNEGLRVYSADTWQMLKQIKLPDPKVVALSFSSDNTQLVASTRDQQTFICDIATKSVVKTITKKELDLYSHAGCILFNSARRKLYIASQYGLLFSYSLEDGSSKKLEHLGFDSQATCTEAFSPDGRWLLGVKGRAFYLYDIENETLLDLHDGHSDQINSVSSAPNGKSVALADNDGILRIWSAVNGEREWILEQSLRENQRRESLLSVAYHPAGHEIYAIQYWNQIRRWELSSGLESPLEPSYYKSITPNDQYPTTFALSTFTLGPDGDLALLSGPQSSSDYSSENASYRVILYSLSQMKILWVESDKISRFSTYTFSPSGDLVLQVISTKEARSALGGIDMLAKETPQDHAGQGRIFSVKDGSILRTFRGPKGEGLRVGKMLSGDRVIAAMRGGLALWALDKPKEALYLRAPDSATKPLVVSDDESLCAAASEKGDVFVWYMKTGAIKEHIPLSRTHDRATCMTFCHQTNQLLIGTAKGVGLLFGTD
jgi:WD40 repeat protein